MTEYQACPVGNNDFASHQCNPYMIRPAVVFASVMIGFAIFAMATQVVSSVAKALEGGSMPHEF